MGRVVVVGQPSIHWAAATDKKNSLRLPALYLAVAHSNMDMVALLTNTRKVNSLDNCLSSALHWAELGQIMSKENTVKKKKEALAELLQNS